MARQITVTISETIYQQAVRLAQWRRQNVAEVLAEAIVLSDEPQQPAASDADEEAIEKERAAFLTLHPTLLKNYRGQYVAIYEGQLVDFAPNLAELYRRVSAKYPDAFVLMRRVEPEPERVYHMRSPRLVEDF
jgi:hypothetical protein